LVSVNGELLDRAGAEVDVRPHLVSFRWPDGIVLTLRPLWMDRDDLKITLSGAPPDSRIDFFLVFPSGVEVVHGKRTKHTGLLPFLVREGGADTLGVGIASLNSLTFVEMRPKSGAGASGLERRLIGKTVQGVSAYGDRIDLLVVNGRSINELLYRANRAVAPGDSAARERREWLLGEINRAPFRCSDERLNLALNWAKVQMAMLFAEEETLIWAGLPWFNDGWGRDTFISLPGACLVLGKYEAAGKILRRFARWQETDPDSPDYGKIPNRARYGEVSYNTADGTPWFVREVYEYGLYSGDRSLWREFMQPGGVIERANGGTLSKRTDESGLLVHGDAETWMDAVGPAGPWSPRGNRAVEVQALWLAQLEASLRMAEALPDLGLPAGTLARWRTTAEKVRTALREEYLRPDGLGLYDHLDPDGTPDTKLRPNQLFALTVPLEPVYAPDERERIVRVVRDNLVYRWGVASLAQSDPDFHPYHQTIHYPKDAAYHMGIVWTWLSGPYKSTSGLGWTVALDEVDQILDRGVPGTLSEVLDAVPREGEDYPRLSGTVSQAWSLAEFLRTWYQDYLGLRPAPGAPGENAWDAAPRIPEEWGRTEAVLDLGGVPVLVEIDPGAEPPKFAWRPLEDGAGPVSLTLRRPVAHLSARQDEPTLRPRIAPDLKALRPPDYPLLSGPEIAAEPSANAVTLVDVSDPEGDDVGGNG
ncbi:MAG TPA: hypothetical protein ENI92_09065, partial [Bacteroidetes bacterium]|nr:hypothetical protein [Bacteroidota bacterium]